MVNIFKLQHAVVGWIANMGSRGVDTYIFLPGPDDFIHTESRLKEVSYIDFEPACVEECVCEVFSCTGISLPTTTTIHQLSSRIHPFPAP